MTGPAREARLLPCPFCGGGPTTVVEGDASTDLWVWCEECGVGYGHALRADALAAWNLRAAPPSAPSGTDARRFPVQTGVAGSGGFTIPWSLVAPFEKQAQRNHGHQSLDDLARRGGLSPLELWFVMHAREWRSDGPHPTSEEALEWALKLAAPPAAVAPAPEARAEEERLTRIEVLVRDLAHQPGVPDRLGARENAIRDVMLEVRELAANWLVADRELRALRAVPARASDPERKRLFAYQGRIYIRPVGRGLCLGEQMDALEEVLPDGWYEADIAIYKETQ